MSFYPTPGFNSPHVHSFVPLFPIGGFLKGLTVAVLSPFKYEGQRHTSSIFIGDFLFAYLNKNEFF